MTNIYLNAMALVNRRIKHCGQAISMCLDELDLYYWNIELNKAKRLHCLISKRLKYNYNVIKVDFNTKKRLAG